MATHCSTLAWKIPWTEEPGGLQSMGSLRVRFDWTTFTFTFHFHALEKEMVTHSRVLAWRIPGMGEPGGLPSMGSHRVGQDWSDLAAAAASYTFSRESSWPRFELGLLHCRRIIYQLSYQGSTLCKQQYNILIENSVLHVFKWKFYSFRIYCLSYST